MSVKAPRFDHLRSIIKLIYSLLNKTIPLHNYPLHVISSELRWIDNNKVIGDLQSRVGKVV